MTVPLGELIAAAQVRRAGEADLPVLSMTMHGGLVDQSAKFKKRVASADTSDYKVVSRGQLVVGFPIDEGVLDFQSIYPQGIVSPAYGVWDLIDETSTDRNYLRRFLRSPAALSYYKAKLRGSTARRRSLPTAVFLELPVPHPSIEKQQRIAAILDRADELRGARRTVIDQLEQLADATFDEAFGASIDEPTATLGELADVSSGITKGRRATDPTTPTPYLAVVNVQAGHLNLEQVKEIEATDKEIQRYALAAGDIVLTEGGDPDKLGRGTVWREELSLCLHQNHIFRVRLRDDRLLADYLSAYLASRPAKSYFLRSAKQTTGIASINMAQLRSTPIYVPPLRDQQKYLSRVRSISEHRMLAKNELSSLDELFVALQARAFSGQL